MNHSKAELVAQAKQRGIALGDYARKSKEEVLALLKDSEQPGGVLCCESC